MTNTNPSNYKVTLDRDDVDNAILDYIHKAFPDTDGLDIESWKFRDGGVKVEFNPNTPGVGVSASEYNELVYENEQLLNEIEDLQDRNDSLEEELNDLTHDYTEALADCEALEDLEAQLNDELDKAQDEIEQLLKENATLRRGRIVLQASKPTPIAPCHPKTHKSCWHCE
jgi:predicted RNase H-like nuclease (RuvC/YqgF family)